MGRIAENSAKGQNNPGSPGQDHGRVTLEEARVPASDYVQSSKGRGMDGRTLALVGLGSVAAMSLAGFALAGLPGTWTTAPAQPPHVTLDISSAGIEPDAGVRLNSPTSDVSLYVEPQSVVVESILTYKGVSAWGIRDLPLGFVATAKVFDLSLSSDEGPNGGIISLLKPGVLTVSLSAEEFAFADYDESRVVVHHLDALTGHWRPIWTDVDFASNKVQAQIESLGTFALAIQWPLRVQASPPESSRALTAQTAEIDNDLAYTAPGSPWLRAPAVEDAAQLPTSNPRASIEPIGPNPHPPGVSAGEDRLVTAPTKEHPSVITLDPEILAPARFKPAPSPTPTALPLIVQRNEPLTATPPPSPTPVPSQDWALEEVQARGNVVRVYLKLLGPGLVAVSLDGLETEEIKTVIPYQMHVFRGVSPGVRRVRIWTPGVAQYERVRSIQVYAPTPTPPYPPTSTARPARTPQPRYRLFINQVQVPAQNLLVFIADGQVTLSQAPAPDGRYAKGERVVVLVSPRSGWPLSWGGVDNHDGLIGKVQMVADRFVSVKIGPPPPTPVIKVFPNRVSVTRHVPLPVPQPARVPTPQPTPEPTPVPVSPRRCPRRCPRLSLHRCLHLNPHLSPRRRQQER